MNKKIVVILLIFIFLLSLISCEGNVNDDKNEIVCVEYFTYDWVRNITGDNSDIKVTLLNTSGKDMHSFEPSAKDLVKMSNADMVIYLGGISESWINDFVLKNDVETFSLIDLFISNFSEVYNLDLDDVDEHFYLSPKVSSYLVEEIGKEISKIFSDEKYIDNALIYSNEIKELMNYKMGNKPIVVCDRFPFEYIVDDFNINYYAAFDGCSAETEASFSVITQLVEAIKENNIDTIFVIENSDSNISKPIVTELGGEVVNVIELNSLQSITNTETSYIEVLRKDLELIFEETNR